MLLSKTVHSEVVVAYLPGYFAGKKMKDAGTQKTFSLYATKALQVRRLMI